MTLYEFAAEPGLKREILIADLWAAGTCGIVEHAEKIEAFFDSEAADVRGVVNANNGQLTAPFVPAQDLEEQEERWFLLGQNSVVVCHHDAEIPAGRKALFVTHSDAFGSGRHESTQLVIEALEALGECGAIDARALVLDVGCGSGIVTQAAVANGFRAIGCDIHAGSVAAARRDASQIPFFVGSLDGVRTQTADLVVVNISARVIDRLAHHLARVLKRGCPLILSGFLSQQLPKAFTPTISRDRNDWVCWVCYPDRDDITFAELQSLQPFEQHWW